MPRERGHLRFGYVAGPLYLGLEQLNASSGSVPIFRVNWMNCQSPVHNQIVNVTVEYKDMCRPVRCAHCQQAVKSLDIARGSKMGMNTLANASQKTWWGSAWTYLGL